MCDHSFELGPGQFIKKTGGGTNNGMFGVASRGKSIWGRIFDDIKFGFGNSGGKTQVLGNRIKVIIALPVGGPGPGNGKDDLVAGVVTDKSD